ncbi:TNF receptor-associated factor 6-like [Clytia hemisphaerica]|uniref:RING-type domain-containing protein n=1 Tax=Clytia hemisphaerica TaxID=252671 RepID=A0A7M5WI15_9CNID|eukprot:TCONS_00070078-protein
MSSNKQDILQGERCTTLGACAVDNTKCSICLAQIDRGSKSNKCSHCIKKMNSIPTGFQFETDGEEKKEFECPICLGIIRDATELPCHHLMCLACLEHYENEEKEKVKGNGEDEKTAVYLCSICQKPYQPKDKYQVKSIDRIIQTSIRVKCHQKQCTWVGCIMDYQQHDKICNCVLEPCPYFELGCDVMIERGQIQTHSRSNSIIHETLLLKSVKMFSQERKQYQQQINDQNKKIESLEATVTTLKKHVEKIEKDTAQNILTTKSEAAKAQKMRENIVNIEKDFDQRKAEVQNLKVHAEQLSELHLTLSLPDIRNQRSVSKFLHKKDYDTMKEVKSWNAFVKIANRNKNCSYLNTLKDAINNYSETVFSKKWHTRLSQKTRSQTEGCMVYGYLKLRTYIQIEKISVKKCNDRKEFQEATRDEKWCRHSAFTASFVDFPNEALHVMIQFDFKTVSLFHWEDEEKNRTIPLNGVPVILGDRKFSLHAGVLLRFN